MSYSDFVHLRTHSAYSLSEGAIHTKALAKLASQHNMPAAGIADTANLFGALEYALAAVDVGVQPVVGTLLPMRENSGDSVAYLPAFAQTADGYKNLLHLVSKAFLQSGDEGEPWLKWEQLNGKSHDIIALTGGADGSLGRLLVDGQTKLANDLLDR